MVDGLILRVTRWPFKQVWQYMASAVVRSVVLWKTIGKLCPVFRCQCVMYNSLTAISVGEWLGLTRVGII